MVGAGPAGAAAALGALDADPALRVLLLDRADFPRDKSCGDGIAPHVFDALAAVGVARRRRRLDAAAARSSSPAASRRVARHDGPAGARSSRARCSTPGWSSGAVDRRAPCCAGTGCALAAPPRRRGRRSTATLAARVLVGADGAHSVVRAGARLAGDRAGARSRSAATRPRPPGGAARR